MKILGIFVCGCALAAFVAKSVLVGHVLWPIGVIVYLAGKN